MIKIIPTYFLVFVLILGTMSSMVAPFSSNAFADESKIFPDWVKTVFKFWANGDISDAELKTALEFLIKENILDVSNNKGTIAPKPDASSSNNIKSVDDPGFFSAAKNSIDEIVKTVKNDPTLDLLATSFLPEIPIVGGLLGNLYENASGSTKDKNDTILKVLKEYQKMDESNLKQAFTKLDANKAAIENNTYLLGNLLTDTKQILEYTSDTNVRVKNLEAKLDQISTQLSNIQIGKNTAVISPTLKSELDEITKLNSELDNNANIDSSQLGVLAKTYVLQDDHDSAIKIYDQILQQDSKNYAALNEKAWTLYDSQKFSQSAAAFDEFLIHYPNDSNGWEGKGYSLLELGDSNFDKAREAFSESIRLDNTNAYATAGLGWISLEEGDCQKAESIFNDALSIDNNNEFALE